MIILGNLLDPGSSSKALARIPNIMTGAGSSSQGRDWTVKGMCHATQLLEMRPNGQSRTDAYYFSSIPTVSFNASSGF